MEHRQGETFRELEYRGWTEKAEAYNGEFTAITAQANPLILDGFGDIHGARLLDVACGPGFLTADAASRGANVQGLDFSPAMIREARKNHPGLEFQEGDAENLPFEAESFAAVSCSFGILHLERPERAIREAFRVLGPGGRYAFTIWPGPGQSTERGFMEILANALEKHGTAQVNLPSAPPMFQYADCEASAPLFREIGFEPPACETLSLFYETARPENALDMILRVGVRMPLMILAQPEEAREKILADAREELGKFRDGDGYKIPFPAILVRARKPDA